MSSHRVALIITIVLTLSHVHAARAQGQAAISQSAGAQVISAAEAPPVPVNARLGSPCPAAAPCHAGPWHMVESPSGLRECTEPYARPGTCRASTYGANKLSRLWVMRQGDRWLWCQYRDLSSRCVDMAARPPANLPYPAVQ